MLVRCGDPSVDGANVRAISLVSPHTSDGARNGYANSASNDNEGRHGMADGDIPTSEQLADAVSDLGIPEQVYRDHFGLGETEPVVHREVDGTLAVIWPDPDNKPERLLVGTGMFEQLISDLSVLSQVKTIVRTAME